MRFPPSILVLFAAILPCPALACSICGTMSKRVSLAQEFLQADAVAYGHLANPKLDGKAGTGTTEFHVDRVIKDHPAYHREKMVLLSRYLPVLDPKSPPRYVMFFHAPAKTKEPYNGRQISNPAVLDFVAALAKERDDPLAMLRFAGKHLDHPDPQIAEEAFLAFARADDKSVDRVAKNLSAPMLRKLVKTPDLEPERLGMYAYLLGACGDGSDVELLRSLLKNNAPRYFRAYEGILAGYISLRPGDGWSFVQETLQSEKNDFVLRYAVLRTMRFFYNASPDQYGKQVLAGEALAVSHPDIADVAIQDLIQWKRWDHTRAILANFDRPTHKSPLLRNGIVRYALACPLPEAKTFVDRVRRQDPKLVQQIEEELK